MKEIDSLIKRNDLHKTLTSRKDHMFQNLFTFIEQLFQIVIKRDCQKLKYLEESIYYTIPKLQKQISNNIEKIWLRTILIEILFNLCPKQLNNSEFIDLLDQLSTFKSNQFNNGKQIISQSYNFLKSIFNNQCSSAKQHKDQFHSLYLQTAQELSIIVKKKIANNEFYKSFYQNLKQTHIDYQNQNNFQNYHQTVWKLINYLKSYGIIIKMFKSIGMVDFTMKHFIFATFHLMGKEIIKMYPLIIKLIEYQVQVIHQKYMQALEFSYQSLEKRNKKLNEIYVSNLFNELKNLIKELDSINSIVLYVFYGKDHRRELRMELPKEFILNTGHSKFDCIHKIEEQVHMQRQKRQKQKLTTLNQSSSLQRSVLGSNQSQQIKRSINHRQIQAIAYVKEDIEKFEQKLMICCENTEQSESFVIDDKKSDHYEYGERVDDF